MIPITTHVTCCRSPGKAEISVLPISHQSESSERRLEGESQDIFLIKQDQNKRIEIFHLIMSKCFILRTSKHLQSKCLIKWHVCAEYCYYFSSILVVFFFSNIFPKLAKLNKRAKYIYIYFQALFN